jgi:hypothetical protein
MLARGAAPSNQQTRSTTFATTASMAAVRASRRAQEQSPPCVRTLSDIAVLRRYADLFSEIPEHRFRLDTSSSQIRARAGGGGS